MKKTILVGITSGIAAFKAVDLVARLKKRGFRVIVLMTAHARRMVNEEEFATASGNPVATELFPADFDYQTVLARREVEHISLADQADLACVVPATANFMAKFRLGLADDLLTTTLLATTAPVLLCPSMNVNMWQKPITRENYAALRERGYFFVPPAKGRLACGYDGEGRLAEIDDIESRILELMHRQQELAGKKVIVTAGGTAEPIDSVRVITNRSSGKMGIALADACALRGADVTLIQASTIVAPRQPMQNIRVESAAEMLAALEEHTPTHDVLIHAAAVSDFTVKEAVPGKVASEKSLTLTLTPTPKIIDKIKTLNPDIFLTGFKAECNLSETELADEARALLKRSRADLIVANDVGQAPVFGADANEVLLVSGSENYEKLARADKTAIAEKIIEKIITLINAKKQKKI